MRRARLFLIKIFPRQQLIRWSFMFTAIGKSLFKGKRFYCPICERSYSKFFAYGSPARQHALCPGCLSLERHRLLWFYLKNETNFFKDKLKFLHMAPEQCFYKKFKKQKNLDYLTADLDSPLAKVKTDIQAMQFSDNTFDVIFANHVLEHVEDDIQAMRELYRVLKPGAWAILQVPADNNRDRTFEDKNVTEPADRERYFGQHDHWRLYGRDYAGRLAQVGFQVEANRYCENINQATISKSGLMNEEIIYIARK